MDAQSKHALARRAASGRGPLAGIRVVELGSIGPAPFAGMMLADMGAEVIRVDRASDVGNPGIHELSHQVLGRGRRSLAVDLKHRDAAALVLDLVTDSHVLLEGFRPGVVERLGIGPDEALGRNPRLVFGRMTGWGQDGPHAQRAGHDINYIAVSGALEPIVGSDGAPAAPLNMLGDFGGGGMLLAFGVVAALFHAGQTGQGQVVDAAIVDGTALFTSMLHSMRFTGEWGQSRGDNLFDGGAPYYQVYRTADDRWVSVGAIEPQFYAQLLEGIGLADELADVPQTDADSWPRLRERFAEQFAEQTQEHWMEVFNGTDACVTEVVPPDQAGAHEHLAARGVYIERDGLIHPAPAPRFSATPGALPGATPRVGQHTSEILADWGFTETAVHALVDDGVVRQG